MNTTPETQPSLLLRVRDVEDTEAWVRFVEIYTPLVSGFLVNRGLQQADASDLTQEVLQSVCGAIGRFEYDPQTGTFRSWLFRITRNKLNDYFQRKQKRQKIDAHMPEYQLSDEPPVVNELEEQWERDHQWHLVNWALKKISIEFAPKTIEAFKLATLENKPTDQVANKLGISIGAVYIAKSRVMVRLQEVVKEIEGDDSPLKSVSKPDTE